jgi:hypothetical protein
MTDHQKQQPDRLTTEQARLVIEAIEEIEREESEAGNRGEGGCCPETTSQPPPAREHEDEVRRDD